MVGKIFAFGAISLALLAWSPAAEARVTVIYTLTNDVMSGFFDSGTASGSWTEGTTAADFTSNITVTENFPGGPALTYHFTRTRLGGWSVPSQVAGATGFNASFGVTPIQAGTVSTYLNDFVYGETGYGTLSARFIQAGAPEPSAWMIMVTGFGGAGGALRLARRRRGAGMSLA